MPDERSHSRRWALCASLPPLWGRAGVGGLLLAIALALPTAAEIPSNRAAELEHLVIQDCGSCHGLTMRGGLGRPLTAAALTHADRDTLALIVLDGIPGTAMPPWRPLLTEAEALWIADYLKGEHP